MPDDGAPESVLLFVAVIPEALELIEFVLDQAVECGGLGVTEENSCRFKIRLFRCGHPPGSDIGSHAHSGRLAAILRSPKPITEYSRLMTQRLRRTVLLVKPPRPAFHPQQFVSQPLRPPARLAGNPADLARLAVPLHDRRPDPEVATLKTRFISSKFGSRVACPSNLGGLLCVQARQVTTIGVLVPATASTRLRQRSLNFPALMGFMHNI